VECLAPTIDGARIELRYTALAGEAVVHSFTEVIELPASLPDGTDPTATSLLRLLSFAAAPSYFKAFAPARLVVPGGLTQRERRFLTAVLRQGLGEFAYVNDLPEVLDTEIVADEMPESENTTDSEPSEPRRLLVAVGGGKDSIVSIEALRHAGFDLELFSVNTYAPITATAQTAGIELATVRRSLDPLLFELNAEGAPNGHVPVTAMNSLLAELTALALGRDTVVFSNEASSSYGNIIWHGRSINHQWSKSLEFERLLRDCLPASAPSYLSLLRPLTELRIARGFARLTRYHSVFTSCNRAFKLKAEDRTNWCADCPKCRFVFLCLAPFVPREQLLAIFGGRDMFADPAQTAGFLELLGADGTIKPFECVGEPDECRVALTLLREHPGYADHPFLRLPEIAAVSASAREREAVFAFKQGQHVLPTELEAVARAV